MSLLNKKLEGDYIDSNRDAEDFKYDVVNFMNVRVSYTMKRLMKADLKTIFTFGVDEDLLRVQVNPFDSDYAIERDRIYGGIKISDNITYGW